MIHATELYPDTVYQSQLSDATIWRSEEDHELFDLLIEISARCTRISCSEYPEDKLVLKPKSVVDHIMAQKVKKYKHRIIRLLRDQEYRQTGIIQHPEHVRGLLEEWEQERGKAG